MTNSLSSGDFLSRRSFMAGTSALALGWRTPALARENEPRARAKIAITLDLEMARHYPTWEQTHWDYEKGNLDDDTKRYALEAGKRVSNAGGVIHYFAVGRVFEQESVAWIEELVKLGHPIGNHTYDHVNLLATDRSQIQFRFARAPWLIAGKSIDEVIEENIRLTTSAMQDRLKIAPRGFRTPGGFHLGLREREDLQQMLLKLGFKWVSSLYPPHPNVMPGTRVTSDVMKGIVEAQKLAQPFVYPTGLVEIPMSPISDVNAFRTARWNLDEFLEAIRLGVAWTIENNAIYDFLAHPSCLNVTDPKFQAIELICEMVNKSNGRAKIVSLDEIARTVPPTSTGNAKG